MNGPMKYVITNDTKVMNGETLYRIQSLVDFKTIDGRSVERGDYGGYVSSLNCLSQKGKSWIRSNTCVIGGRVSSNALVAGKAVVIGGKVMNNSIVKGNAKLVCSEVYNSAVVQDNAELNESYVGGTSVICGNAVVSENSQIFGCSRVQDNAQVTNRSYILDGSVCDSSALIHAHIEGYHVKGNSRVRGIHFYGQGNIVDSIIDVRGRFHLLLSCEFNKAKITDASQFFFITLGHWLMLDVAIYPSIDGELLACYAAYGVRSDVVPLKEVDKRVRENKIIPEKLWDSVVALSREFTKEKFDA